MNKQRWAKRKGTAGEREIIDLFWEQKNWGAHRIAGSGSSKYPAPDIIAGNRIRKLAIEAKVTSNKLKYFTLDEIKALQTFSSLFGAEPWVGVKFISEKKWFFFSLEDLNKKEKSYSISLEDGKRKGLLFEELIK